MKKLSVIFFLTILSISTNAKYPNAGYEISIDKPNVTALKTGDEVTLEGSVCVKRTYGFSGKFRCHNTKDSDVNLQFYYPDEANVVTADVQVTKVGKELKYSYNAKVLGDSDEKRFIVIAGTLKSRISKLLAIKAKLQKRIELFEKIRDRYLEKQHHGKVVEIFNHFIARLERVVLGIDGVVNYDPDTLGSLYYPLQVDNKQAAPLVKTSMFGGFKMFFEVVPGSGIEGEKAEVRTKLVNMNNHTYGAPGMHMGWKDYFMKGSLYKIKYEFNGEVIHEGDAGEIAVGEAKEYSFFTDKLKPADENKLVVSLTRTRKGWGHFFNLAWGRLEQIIPVAEDTVHPQWMEPIVPTDEDLGYAQNFPEIIINAKDEFGKIDVNSFKVNLIAEFDDGTLMEGDQTDLFDFEKIEQGQSYIITGDVGMLAEAVYTLEVSGADFAGNAIMANPLTRRIRVDRTAPTVSTDLEDGKLINDPVFSFNISVYDISPTNTKVIHNGVKILVSGSSDIIVSPELLRGGNLFEIISFDFAGNISETVTRFVQFDSIPPEISEVNLEDGQTIYSTTNFNLGFNSNEDISRVVVNGTELGVIEGQRSFNYDLAAVSEGEYLLVIDIFDIAGNVTTVTRTVNIVLRVINKHLVTIEPTNDPNKLLIIGAPFAARPGIEIKLSASFFNSIYVTSAENGSFSAELDYFTALGVEGEDETIDKKDSFTLHYKADTTVSGIVKDVDDMPLPGVTVTIIGSDKFAVTDASGTFHIIDPVTGYQKLIVDGRTIPEDVVGEERQFFTITFPVNIGNRDLNVIKDPIYLTALNLDGSETVIEEAAPQDVVVSNPEVPGVEIHIPSNSATFPDGSKGGGINISQTPYEKTTLTQLDYVRPDHVYSLEPSGLKFDEPVELVLPNENEFMPGIQLAIFSRNSAKGTWEIDGLARVSDDGSSVVTKEGQGITHFSDVFAVPLGLKISKRKAEDMPGVDTLSGSVKSSIDLPSYKSFGQEISHGLVYSSIWAEPTIVIKNILDFDNQEKKLVQKGDKRVLGIGGDYIFQGKTWIESDLIEAQFFTNDLNGEIIPFRGVPNKSVIAYAMDLSEKESGVYSYRSNYQFHFKRLIVGSVRTRSNVWGIKGKYGKGKRIHEEDSLGPAIPQDIMGTYYNQNQINSPYGSGWKLKGDQKLYINNPSVIVHEDGSGGLHRYNISNLINTIYQIEDDGDESTDDETIAAVNFDNWPEMTIVDKENNFSIVGYDAEGSNVETKNYDLPIYFGRYASNHQQKHHKTCGFLGCCKCGYYKCYRATREYTYSVAPSSLLRNNDGNIVFSDYSGRAYLASESSVDLLAGSFRNSKQFGYPASGNSSHTEMTNYCSSNLGLLCGPHVKWATKSGGHNVRTCPAYKIDSTGTEPFKGFAEGQPESSTLNEPHAIAYHPTAPYYVIADTGNNRVRYLNQNTNELTTAYGTGSANDDGDGLHASLAGINSPRGLLYYDNDKDKDNLFVSTGTGQIRNITSDGIITTIAGKNSSENPVAVFIVENEKLYLNNPTGMVYDKDNKYLYVADTGNHRVVRIDLINDVAITIAGSSSCDLNGEAGDGKTALEANLCSPSHLGLDENNNLLILDKGHKKIRRVTFTGSKDSEAVYVPSVRDGSLLRQMSDGTYKITAESKESLHFNSKGDAIKSVSRLGHVTSYERDEIGRIERIIDPTESTTIFSYSGDLLESITDPVGRTTYFDYNGGLLSKVSFPDESEKSFEYYDDTNLLMNEIDKDEHTTNYNYDDFKRLQSVELEGILKMAINDSTSSIIGNGYDSSNPNSLKSLDQEDENGLVDGIVDAKGVETTFEEDINGFISKITDAEGKVTESIRDEQGRPTKVTRPDGTEVNYTYDQDVKDEYGNVLSFGTGKILTKTDSLTGNTNEYQYSESGELLKTYRNGSIISSSEYHDETGLVMAKYDYITQQSQSFVYDENGLVIESYVNGEKVQEFEYDEQGNSLVVKGEGGATIRYLRDAAGNVKEFIREISDDYSITKKFAYDSFNRIVSATDGNGDVTGYGYLPSGKLSTITSPKDSAEHYTSFEYDPLGRLTSKTNSLGRTTVMEYDENDNLAKEIDPNGSLITYDYNDLNKLTAKHLPDNSIHLEYDSRGNLGEIYDDNTKYQLTYLRHDDQYLLESISFEGLNDRTDLMKYTATNSYNGWGDLMKVTDIRGDIKYSYNEKRQVSSITNHKGETFSFNFNDSGGLESVTRPGSKTNYTYDSRSFLQKIIHKTGIGDVISSFDYDRNSSGVINSVSTKHGQIHYEYDLNMQLISSSNNMLDVTNNYERYEYDSIGNRANSNGEYGESNYDPTGQLLVSDLVHDYLFDDNGNLIQKNQQGTIGVNFTNYSYSSANQLIRVEKYTGGNLVKEIDYLYSATGHRIEKDVVDSLVPAKSFTRRYAYNVNDISAELDGNNNILAKYTYSGLRTDGVMAVDVQTHGVGKVAKEAKSYFFLKDALGSINNIVDASGAIVQHHVYSAFGKLLKVVDGVGNSLANAAVVEPFFTFTGREYDKETGLYYYRARTYDPAIGRFLSADPSPGKINNPITVINKYVYAGNNPISFADPNGRIFVTLLFGALILGGEIGGSALLTAAIIGGVGSIAAIEIFAYGGSTEKMFEAEGLNILAIFALGAIGGGVGQVVGKFAFSGLYNLTKGSAAFSWLTQGFVGKAVQGGLSGAFQSVGATGALDIGGYSDLSFDEYLDVFFFGLAGGAVTGAVNWGFNAKLQTPTAIGVQGGIFMYLNWPSKSKPE